jgi:hypothetical protein
VTPMFALISQRCNLSLVVCCLPLPCTTSAPLQFLPWISAHLPAAALVLPPLRQSRTLPLSCPLLSSTLPAQVTKPPIHPAEEWSRSIPQYPQPPNQASASLTPAAQLLFASSPGVRLFLLQVSRNWQSHLLEQRTPGAGHRRHRTPSTTCIPVYQDVTPTSSAAAEIGFWVPT